MKEKTCTRCTKKKPLTTDHWHQNRGKWRAICAACRNTEKVAQRAAAKEQEQRLASDYERLRPEDFVSGVGNDGRRDPKAAKEKRQEFSPAMGELADALIEANGDLSKIPPHLGTFLGRLAEEERRFGNRRLARALSLIAAQQELNVRRFRQVATQYLSAKVQPAGFALEERTPAIQRSDVLLLSDLHIGADLSGRDNPMRFGAREEARRLEHVALETVHFKVEHRAQSELVLLLNGDLIEGKLGHDLLSGAPIFEQKAAFWHYLSRMIGLFAKHFPRVRVYCQPGNHGRDKLRHPGRAFSEKWQGHETEMYYVLSVMCSELVKRGKVSFDIPEQAISVVDLHGHKLCLTHGDTEIKLGDPDTQATQNAMSFDRVNATGIFGHRFDVFAIGHFHKPRWIPRNPHAVFNGALIPPNGHARSMGYIGEPCGQYLWEAVPGYPVGDVRFLHVGPAQDRDERLGKIITPFRFDRKAA
jgi:hypothetical protein